MTGLRWTKEGQKLVLEGIIDENVRFDDLLGEVGKKSSVVLDLAAIARINSTGVREWMRFIEKANDGNGLVLMRCSVPFVSQLNMVQGFVGRAVVQSVMAPYECPACGARRTERFDVTPELDEKLKAPLPCPQCGGKMELDEIPEMFAAFAKH